MNRISVGIYGMGPVGCNIYGYLSQKKTIRLAGVVDDDKEKTGKDLSEIIGLADKTGIRVSGNTQELIADRNIDLAILSTVSGIEKIYPLIMEILEEGINIVSTCEELSYPWLTKPFIAREIDKKAKQKNVTVLGTGVNPGFLMDFLPLAMTGISTSVEKIRVERFQDASVRRLPFQKKIGAGLTVEQFEEKVKESVLRHVGLTESMHLIAHSIGWDIDSFTEEIEPVIALEKYSGKSYSVEKGDVTGVRQTGCAVAGGKELLKLIFHAEVGFKHPYDRLIIEGRPPIDMTIKNGINGDISTAAIAVNAIPFVANASAGLKTMADIGPAFYRKM